MINNKIRGVYPTMITPFFGGEIDYGAVDAIVEWYASQDCDGVFAACQSSEISFLSVEERVALVRAVVAKRDELFSRGMRRMTVVASGHVSDSFEAQVRELTLIAGEKPDALILISNRMDIENTSDAKWIEDTERLIAKLPDIPLGVYECPCPYRRPLTEEMIKWCVSTGRFRFIKDTSCDAAVMASRTALCRGSELHLFNANAQTLLQTLRDGASGYCGVMANFHPALFARLINCYESDSETAELIQSFLGTAAFTESMPYPITAKFHLQSIVGLPLKSLETRSRKESSFTDYHRDSVRQLDLLAKKIGTL